jgi:hypothetical protein
MQMMGCLFILRRKTMRKKFALYVLILAGLASNLVGMGMAAPTSVMADGENFTIVVLPDTQYYSQSRPDIFSAQTQWIVDNRDTLNIAYVAHEGDIVNVAGDTGQWDNAESAMELLEGPFTGLPDGIPYGVVPGNHDQPTTNYNAYFGVSRFWGRDYYGGYYGTNNDNNYTLFSAGGMDFIVINLNYHATNIPTAILNWADGLLKDHSDRRAIVVSHYILDVDGSFGGPGQGIYNALRDNPNLFLMLCGHMHDEARRTDMYGGNTIYTLLADYQDYPDGGSGYLRILEFSPADDEIQIRTYSPTLDQYQTDADSEFTLSYDMEVPEYTLTVDVSGSGVVNKDPDQPDYTYGEEVELTAVAATGWSFAGWSGDVVSTTNPLNLVILDDTSLTATFTQDEYTLMLNVVGSGAVTRDPDQPTYHYDDEVTLTAEADPGWSFAGWSGDVISTANPLDVVVQDHMQLTAQFVTYRFYFPVLFRR